MLHISFGRNSLLLSVALISSCRYYRLFHVYFEVAFCATRGLQVAGQGQGGSVPASVDIPAD